MSNNNGFTPSEFQEAIFSFVTDSNPAKRHGSVNAVAGSGKSTTCVQASQRIDIPGVMCAFNKHIAESLKEKLAGSSMTAQTIHSIGMRTLSKKLPKRPKLDDNKYRRIIREYLKEYRKEFEEDPEAHKRLSDLTRFARLTLTDYRDLSAVIQMSNRYNLDFETPDRKRMQSILDYGEKLAVEQGEIDFTDMIYLPNRLNLTPEQYGWVFVDEAQDLSTAQRELVRRSLAPDGRALFVGDPYQAIMFFAGADCESYQTIAETMDTHEMPLSICYRCPSGVIDLAASIVPQILARPNAPEGTIEHLKEEDILTRARQGDLIMCRKNAPLIKHALRLIRRGIHARVRGRNIGQELADLARRVGAGARDYEDFQRALEECFHEQQAHLIAKDASDTQLEMLDDKYAALSECYEGFSECHSTEALAEKIENIFSDNGTAVWFSSIHRAKGLEAERTWILEYDRLGQPMGKNASDAEAQQEVNLRYVALTRSLDTMYLLNSEGR